jgi:predicted MPP superfamily phosphohydrolase
MTAALLFILFCLADWLLLAALPHLHLSFAHRITFSRYGRRYASGLFQKGETTLYVSRGLGFEGGGMPRARFLCRPEIVSFELYGRP